MRCDLRFGYGFESCEANNLRPKEIKGREAMTVPKRGKFHAAIRVTPNRCKSCIQ